jgi:hypothetical protein
MIACFIKRMTPNYCFFPNLALHHACHTFPLTRKKWKLHEIYFILYCKQVTKIGRDAVLDVESLIESIMGGLEGLINILDSEGGFGALETQVFYIKLVIYYIR